jgi:hypothetical protein
MTTISILAFCLITLCLVTWMFYRVNREMMNQSTEMTDPKRMENLVRVIGEVVTLPWIGRGEEKVDTTDPPPILAWDDPISRNLGEVGDTLSREEMDQVEEMLYMAQAEQQKDSPSESE